MSVKLDLHSFFKFMSEHVHSSPGQFVVKIRDDKI